jgi:hypothetical protein
MRGVHDIGGLPGGPVDRTEHEPALWEKRVHALLILLSEPERKLMTVDELRRGIESLGEVEYNRLAYYEKWITSITDNLLAKGVITPDELGRKLAEIEARPLREPATECRQP